MLLTYLAVLVVVILVLLGSFRALGGGEPVPAEDYRTVLGRLCEFTSTRLAELASAIDEAPVGDVIRLRTADLRPREDPLVVVASAARKKLGGYHQQLARIESAATGDERESLEAVRTLLTAAVEDLAWACRLIEGGTYADNPGIQGAVERLRDHGRECLAAAAGLVER